MCKGNFKYSLIKEYDLSNAPFILNLRVKIKKKKKHSIHLFRRGIETWYPAWQAGIFTTILPRRGFLIENPVKKPVVNCFHFL